MVEVRREDAGSGGEQVIESWVDMELPQDGEDESDGAAERGVVGSWSSARGVNG